MTRKSPSLKKEKGTLKKIGFLDFYSGSVILVIPPQGPKPLKTRSLDPLPSWSHVLVPIRVVPLRLRVLRQGTRQLTAEEKGASGWSGGGHAAGTRADTVLAKSAALIPPGAVRSGRAWRGSIGIAATRKQQKQRCRFVSGEISRAGRLNPRATPQSRSVGTSGYAPTESSVLASSEVIMSVIAAWISHRDVVSMSETLGWFWMLEEFTKKRV